MITNKFERDRDISKLFIEQEKGHKSGGLYFLIFFGFCTCAVHPF